MRWIGRKIGLNMEKILGQPVVVINKPGGGGLVALKALSVSEPTGYIIAMIVVNNALIQKNMKTLPSWVDPLKELSLVGIINKDDWGIAVKKDAPYNTLKEFIEYLKKNQNVKVSDGGPGSAYHWGWESFMETTGVKVKTVAYKGTSRALKALAGGEIEAAASSAPEADAMVRAKLIKMLGVAAEKRSSVYPDIPTFKEQGIDMVYGISRGIVAPAKTPQDIIKKLAEVVKQAYQSNDYTVFLNKTGFGKLYMGPAEGTKFIEREDMRYRKLMSKAGLLRK